MLPLSPYLVQRPNDLSESLTGTDPEGDKSGHCRLKLGKLILGQKYKMGWYKVPCLSFDYAPATLDPILVDRGSRSRKSARSIPLCLSGSSETPGLSLVGSFNHKHVESRGVQDHC